MGPETTQSGLAFHIFTALLENHVARRCLMFECLIAQVLCKDSCCPVQANCTVIRTSVGYTDRYRTEEAVGFKHRLTSADFCNKSICL